MKCCKLVLSVSVLALSAFLASCGDDSGSNAKEEKKVEASMQVDDASDLPDCDKNYEGEIAEINGEDELFVCSDGEWKEFVPEDDEEETESSSSGKKSGKSSGSKDSKDSSASEDGSESSNSKGSSASGDNPDSSASEGSSASDGSSASEGSSASNSSSSSKKAELPNSGTIEDSRDGQKYKYVRIGSQVWFAQNLNYDDGLGVCADGETANCDKYGRLYRFDASEASSVMTLCPRGWHFPDSSEWATLFSYVSKNNGGEPVGVSLKASNGWISEGSVVTVESDDRDPEVRTAASTGTDKFGFTALPAGSCWDLGDKCYIDDDARFAVSKEQRSIGAFKFAFDEDEPEFDKYAVMGYISVRCLKNDVELDAIPPIDVVDGVVWMAEDATHNGSKKFSLSEALQACPEGWRLPTQQEFSSLLQLVDGSQFFGVSVGSETPPFYASSSENNSAVGIVCSTLGPEGTYCYAIGSSTPEYVRCVREEKVNVEKTAVDDCSCKSLGFDSGKGTASWSFTCSKGSYDYSWDFGDYSKGVNVSGNTATGTFTEMVKFAPQVNVKGEMNIDGETYSFNYSMECPAVLTADAIVEFKDGSTESVDLFSGVSYTAVIDAKSCTTAYLSCSFSSTNGSVKTLVINGDNVAEDMYHLYTNVADYACNGASFTIEVSDDAQCSMQYW